MMQGLRQPWRLDSCLLLQPAQPHNRLDLQVCVPMHWQVDTHLNDESLREGLKPRTGAADCWLLCLCQGFANDPNLRNTQKQGRHHRNPAHMVETTLEF